MVWRATLRSRTRAMASTTLRRRAICMALLSTLLAAAAGTEVVVVPGSTVPPPRRGGAMVYLANGDPQRLDTVCLSLKSLHTFYLSSFPAPIIMFVPMETGRVRYKDAHGDEVVADAPLTQEQRAYLQRCASSSHITFAPVDVAAYVSREAVAAAPVKFMNFGFGYRFMCNFFAGPVALQPALARFKYYWRMDSDSYLMDYVKEDMFQRMDANRWKYAYAKVTCEVTYVVEGLSAAAEAHFGADKLRSMLPPEFTDDSCTRSAASVARKAVYNNRMFYNNFEVVEIETLRSDAYQAYYRALRDSNGIMTQRWGDAPIRALGISALLPPREVHQILDVAHYHQEFLGPLPSVPSFIVFCYLWCTTGWVRAVFFPAVTLLALWLWLALGSKYPLVHPHALWNAVVLWCRFHFRHVARYRLVSSTGSNV